jgi:HD-like signal output (HDOD) protein
MSSPGKPKLLFVDDEDNILRGIARMLRGKRSAWDMSFAASGAIALDMMAKDGPPTLLVTDMRMPGMDGAELLVKVRALYPKTIRFVLSGFAEREAILKTIGPSHRYLAKPCDENILTQSIENSLKLRALMHGSTLETKVAGMSFVPSPPKIYADILTELASEFSSADSLGEKIEQDVGISAQLLKLTNSAYFNLPSRCATIKQAINFLGFDNVRAAVLMAGVFDQFRDLTPAMVRLVESVSRHSLGLGALAKALAKADGLSSELVDQAFCAGILAHIGTVVLAAGAYLLGLWGFNDSIVEAIAHHHRPSVYTGTPAPILTALHAAQFLARTHSTNAQQRVNLEGLDTEYIEAAGGSARLQEWQKVYESVTRNWPHD